MYTTTVKVTTHTHTEGGSYPGHLSKVCVHVLVTDWNHLSDALVVTGGKHTHIFMKIKCVFNIKCVLYLFTLFITLY